MMTLESWSWLTQLIESGSFTRASDALQISQQTLSARLATLERSLGCKLVVRSNPLALTRAGEVFLSYAHEQELARTAMLRRIGEVSIGGAGELKVGISNIRGQILMPHVVEQFHRSLPGVNIRLIEGTNEELVRMAERNEADVVVARFDEVHPGVTVRPLFSEQVVCAVHPQLLEQATGLPLDLAREKAQAEGLAALRDCPFLLESVDDISGRVARVELGHAGFKPQVLMESDNMMTLLASCAAGLGAVFCPTNLLEDTAFLTKGLVRIELSEDARYNIASGTPANAEPWTPAQMFEDVIGALFGDE